MADRGVPGTAATFMPQTGSTAVSRIAGLRLRTPTTLARIESAISAGYAPDVEAGRHVDPLEQLGRHPVPRSSPSTPSPRLALATRPT